MNAALDFEGKTAAVTGAASGIGRQIAMQFIAGGATVFALDRNLEGVPDGSIAIAVDVSDMTSMTEAAGEILKHSGSIDVMCNNAAINAFTDLISATVDEFDQIMAVNARGVFIGMKVVLPHMLEAGRGAIVNTSSTAAVIGIPDRASYSASKGAVTALTRQVAVQYAGRGVRCNCICPGSTDSPMVADVIAASQDPAAMRLAMATRQPIGRMASPDEIAAAAVFLASDRASFITGVSLTVDGGWTIA
jgi:NAD(P)-dependent dehydrogenase (short-subunit alcohol dehydrogenase family)